MASSVAELRAFGTAFVGLVTRDGTFEGRIVQELLSDGAIVVMIAPPGMNDEAVVVAIDAIEEIVQRSGSIPLEQ